MQSELLPEEQVDADENEEKLKRQIARRGLRALEALREVLASLGAEAQEISDLSNPIENRIEELKPPDRRKCKEYKRAATRAAKGEIGMDPEEVVFYCTCRECREIRERRGLPFRGREEGDSPEEPLEDLQLAAAE